MLKEHKIIIVFAIIMVILSLLTVWMTSTNIPMNGPVNMPKND